VKKLLKYDYFYLLKTSKFIVFGAIVVLFSITSPLTAKYMNEILEFFLNGQELGFAMPEPTIYTAYTTYVSDMYEIVFTVTIFVGVSIFIRDKTKGLLPLIFSKPINRSKYVLSKYISFISMLLVCILLGNLVFSYYTYFLFKEILFIKGIYMSLYYFLDIMFVSAVALFSAVHFKSYIPAMIVTWGMYIFSGIVSIADRIPVIKYFPGKIQSNIGHIIYGTQVNSDIIWNIIVVFGLIALLLAMSIKKIRHQDI
jgi:ABC-2 type transport system permease protein